MLARLEKILLYRPSLHCLTGLAGANRTQEIMHDSDYSFIGKPQAIVLHVAKDAVARGLLLVKAIKFWDLGLARSKSFRIRLESQE